MIQFLKDKSQVLLLIGFAVFAVGAISFVGYRKAGIFILWPQFVAATGLLVYIVGRIFVILDRKDKINR